MWGTDQLRMTYLQRHLGLGLLDRPEQVGLPLLVHVLALAETDLVRVGVILQGGGQGGDRVRVGGLHGAPERAHGALPAPAAAATALRTTGLCCVHHGRATRQ